MMIIIDLEMPLDEIWDPILNNMKDEHHIFLIGGYSQINATQLFTVEIQGIPFLHQDHIEIYVWGMTFQDKSLSEIGHY